MFRCSGVHPSFHSNCDTAESTTRWRSSMRDERLTDSRISVYMIPRARMVYASRRSSTISPPLGTQSCDYHRRPVRTAYDVPAMREADSPKQVQGFLPVYSFFSVTLRLVLVRMSQVLLGLYHIAYPLLQHLQLGEPTLLLPIPH